MPTRKPRSVVDIRSLARVHTEAAIRTLVHVMRQKEAAPAARVNAAQVLLDRGWGKAQQNHVVEPGEGFAALLEALDKRGINGSDAKVIEHTTSSDDTDT